MTTMTRTIQPLGKSGRAIRAVVAIIATLAVWSTPSWGQAVLEVDIKTAYNLVVDSNVTAPSTYAPRVASVVASAPVDAAPGTTTTTTDGNGGARAELIMLVPPEDLNGDGDGDSDEEGAAGGEVAAELSGLSRVAHTSGKSATPSTAAGGSPRTPMSYQRSGARWVRQGGGAMLAFDVNSGADERPDAHQGPAASARGGSLKSHRSSSIELSIARASYLRAVVSCRRRFPVVMSSSKHRCL